MPEIYVSTAVGGVKISLSGSALRLLSEYHNNSLCRPRLSVRAKWRNQMTTTRSSSRPDRDRFDRPYVHTLTSAAAESGVEPGFEGGTNDKIIIKQARFGPEGFASTVWDSAIVMSRFLEAHPEVVKNKKCIDLSAGCGLVGIVAARVGAARVVATDLPGNLSLLETNCTANAPTSMSVSSLTWGEDVSSLDPPFDVVLATDVMYVREAVDDLLITLRDLCWHGPPRPANIAIPLSPSVDDKSDTTAAATAATPSASPSAHGHVYLAHGRNRFAEELFMSQAAAQGWVVRTMSDDELHADYVCSDVNVYHMIIRG